MDEPKNRIRVPKPAPSSFNANRPLAKNALLRTQVAHFQELEKKLLPEHQTGIAPESIETEAHASEYIRRMTKKLHGK